MKLVIADDSSMMRERIKSQLSDFAEVFVAGEATTGLKAMEMVLEFDPDLIILDLHMPEMGGVEVLKRIKEAKLRTKVCVLTNYSYPQYHDRCMALGADYFLSKSENFEKINLVIANILELIDAQTTTLNYE